MQFFIALAVLIAAASAYLLHQFWSRSLSGADDMPLMAATGADDETAPSRLKAA